MLNIQIRPDESQRRAFWKEQMDAAYELAEQFRRYPVEECNEPLLSLREAAASAGVEMIFSRTKHCSGYDRLFFLREGLVDSVLAIARDMKSRGWVLNIEDGYRTRAMQKGIAQVPQVFDLILQRVLWETGSRVPAPEFMLRRITAVIATMPKIGTHMSGSALDISVMQAGDGMEVDRGGPYLEISELTPLASPFISARARKNRAAITALMARHGFSAYPYEFWHYSKGDAYAEYLQKTGKPARYGAVDWDQRTGNVTPLDNPETLLNSLEEIEAEIRHALARQPT
ncbi:MAG: hypothetical protein KKG09_10460 [Verrucomicrobia bacterium]|nr:hypothetical protein [Verrucomicrobiota bacterium]MBU4291652.1 hypothetical protein [Verrucomicrobiota bacterium]MBU4428476.1 hypothetical protein [Verrucomicrobiota bacterium]MBU4498414.1 hypothetical protein [Verrucomicrobiota bacterium]MCG2679041.1 hypothetical protein [Kiritimatiellia bacterium]